MADTPRSHDDMTDDDLGPMEAGENFAHSESEMAEPVGSPQTGFDFPTADEEAAVPVGAPQRGAAAWTDTGTDEGPAEPLPPEPRQKPARSSRGMLIGGVVVLLGAAGGVSAWQSGLLGGGAAPVVSSTPKPPTGLAQSGTNPNGAGSPAQPGAESTNNNVDPAEVAATEPPGSSTPAETATPPDVPTATTDGSITTPAAPASAVVHVNIPQAADLSEKPEPDRIAAVKAVMEDIGKSSLKADNVQKCLDLIRDLKQDVKEEQLLNQLRLWERTLQIALRQVSVVIPPDTENHALDSPGATRASHIGHPIAFILSAVLSANETPFPMPDNFPPSDATWETHAAEWKNQFLDLWSPAESSDEQASILAEVSEWTYKNGYFAASHFYVAEAMVRLGSANNSKADATQQLLRSDARRRIELVSGQLSLLLSQELLRVKAELAKAQTESEAAKESLGQLLMTQQSARTAALAVVAKQFAEPSLMDRWQKLDPANGPKVDDEQAKQLQALWQAKAERLAALKKQFDDAQAIAADAPYDGVESAAVEIAGIAAVAGEWERDRQLAQRLQTKLSATQFSAEFLEQLKAQFREKGLLEAWAKLEKLQDVKLDDLVTKTGVEAAANSELDKHLKKLFGNLDPKNPETLLALAARITETENQAKALAAMDEALAKKYGSLDDNDKVLAEKIVAAIKQSQQDLQAAKAESKTQLEAADQTEQTRIAMAKSALSQEITNNLNTPRPLPKDQLGSVAGDVAAAVKTMLFGWGYVPPSAPPVAPLVNPAVTPDPLRAIEHFQAGYQRYFQSGDDAEREAIQQLSLACELDPDNVQYTYFLGLAYYRAGEIEKAAVQTRHAAQLEMQTGSGDISRRLERVQYGPRQWLERVRETVRVAANR